MSSLLAVLDAVEAQPVAVELRARSYELLGDLTGRTVVDAGCGGGPRSPSWPSAGLARSASTSTPR